MLFDQLDLLRAGDVLVLDRGYPATWLVQLLHQRGIDFIIRCDSTHSWKAARELPLLGCHDGALLDPACAGAKSVSQEHPAQASSFTGL